MSSPPIHQHVILLELLVSLLGGCAVVGGFTADRPPPPEHFAEHDTSHLHFDLHWTLERSGDRMVVSGIVVASRISRVREVTVEAVGLDGGGRVVSRGLGTTYRGAWGRDESGPFLIRLRPSGREATFKVRIWHFLYDHGLRGSIPKPPVSLRDIHGDEPDGGSGEPRQTRQTRSARVSERGALHTGSPWALRGVDRPVGTG